MADFGDDEPVGIPRRTVVRVALFAGAALAGGLTVTGLNRLQPRRAVPSASAGGQDETKATGTEDRELFPIEGAQHIETYWIDKYVDGALGQIPVVLVALSTQIPGGSP